MSDLTHVFRDFYRASMLKSLVEELNNREDFSHIFNTSYSLANSINHIKNAILVDLVITVCRLLDRDTDDRITIHSAYREFKAAGKSNLKIEELLIKLSLFYDPLKKLRDIEIAHTLRKTHHGAKYDDLFGALDAIKEFLIQISLDDSRRLSTLKFNEEAYKVDAKEFWQLIK